MRSPEPDAKQHPAKPPGLSIHEPSWETAAPTVLARFPAGTHLKAHRLRDAPPRWPVSGLAETTRVPFPGDTDVVA
ncbi:hypothetical protein BH11PSE9_BH11PSE9_05940 [soil metagenome]